MKEAEARIVKYGNDRCSDRDKLHAHHLWFLQRNFIREVTRVWKHGARGGGGGGGGGGGCDADCDNGGYYDGNGRWHSDNYDGYGWHSGYNDSNRGSWKRKWTLSFYPMSALSRFVCLRIDLFIIFLI